MAMTFEDARHLLARTGFGGTPDEIRQWSAWDRNQAVAKLLDQATTRAVTASPAWINRLPPAPAERKQMGQAEKKAFREERKEESLELKAWWYRELLATPSPLTERMTLFWHNHFTSSFQKVKWPPFLYRQNVLFRSQALGSFRELLSAVAKDPAMLLYLDTQQNQKDRPNENFARELFELFTLGEGRYSEQDIKEAARCFTGWHVDRRTGTFRMNQARHDHGIKRLFGRTGPFMGDDVLRMTLEQSHVAVHLTQKLWKEFVSDQPDPQETERLADLFRRSDYRIKTLLQALLTTPQFWASENRGILIKSPVELLVGTMRLFNLPLPDQISLVRAGRRLGQDLFDPPNVKGWPGGVRWITTATLPARWHMLQQSIRGHEVGHRHGESMGMGGDMGDGNGMADWLATEPEEILQVTLLPIPPVRLLDPGEDRRQVVRQLVLDPAYQLK
ncbi:hypothetical protein DNFV4_01226 [Nitrospira tepida]|uniref:DUF1800 domain-containing protein n=1 Tax=Nitrospira tepida TaxID=2973512 RepID=A0AA86MXJ6_9BACT|nr:DUF1800 domain-containing protein [Nitrospira tepida]CAI4030796.1 hypothetical protein DNFV4_01226 [Nitrospira tepida]